MFFISGVFYLLLFTARGRFVRLYRAWTIKKIDNSWGAVRTKWLRRKQNLLFIISVLRSGGLDSDGSGVWKPKKKYWLSPGLELKNLSVSVVDYI